MFLSAIDRPSGMCYNTQHECARSNRRSHDDAGGRGGRAWFCGRDVARRHFHCRRSAPAHFHIASFSAFSRVDDFPQREIVVGAETRFVPRDVQRFHPRRDRILDFVSCAERLEEARLSRVGEGEPPERVRRLVVCREPRRMAVVPRGRSAKPQPWRVTFWREECKQGRNDLDKQPKQRR